MLQEQVYLLVFAHPLVVLIILAVVEGLFAVALHAAVLAVPPQLGHLYYAALVVSLIEGLLGLVALEEALRCLLLIVLHQYLADPYSVEFVVFLLEDLSEDGLLLVVLLAVVLDDGVVDGLLLAVHGERRVDFALFNGALLGLLLRCPLRPLAPLFLESNEGVCEVVDLGLEEVECLVVALVLPLDQLVLLQGFPLGEWRVDGFFDPFAPLVGSEASVGRAVGERVGLVEGCEVGEIGIGSLRASEVQTIDCF